MKTKGASRALRIDMVVVVFNRATTSPFRNPRWQCRVEVLTHLLRQLGNPFAENVLFFREAKRLYK